jgi:hypothetical protein
MAWVRKWAPSTALIKARMPPTTSMPCHCSRCDAVHQRMHAEGTRTRRAINTAQKSCDVPSVSSASLKAKHQGRCQAGPCEEHANASADRAARRRIRGAYLGRICVWADRLVTVARAVGLGCKRIFRPHASKRTLHVCLRRPVGDALNILFATSSSLLWGGRLHEV